MKIAAQHVGSVLRDPGRVFAILFHGDEWGLMRDRGAAATRAVIGSGNDPFRASVLTREEHGRLRNEVTARTLGGGRRVIRVQDATDSLAAVLEPLTKYSADALVLLEGGHLTPRSKLRVLADKHPAWAAIGCYPESGNAIAAEIARTLSANGISASTEALEFLGQELAGDSIRRRSELEKLVLYAAGGRVELEDARACCAAGLDASLGMAVSAALGGHAALFDALFEELVREGATGQGLLAVLSNQVMRLLKIRLLMQQGRSAEEACRSLQPPVYPRQLPPFLREVERWTIPGLEALGLAVRSADAACKRAGSADMAIAGGLLLSMAGRRGPVG